MRVDLFDFDLPDRLIATEPAVPREAARLLCIDNARFEDHRIADLPVLLRRGDLLVFNDTKVIPAQLEGVRERASDQGEWLTKVGITLHRRVSENRWHGFVRGARKLKPGDRVAFGLKESPLLATALTRGDDGSWEFAFDLADRSMVHELERVGSMPLPPYITSKRKTRQSDTSDYQTVFARHEGAVAAPTAGLHFTPNLLTRLEEAGIRSAPATLHVGAGTFLPVKADDTDEHEMHSEWGAISAETADAVRSAKDRGGRVVAVGTTSLRILEAASQASDRLEAWSGTTDIFITPGYRFRNVDMLLTNFHLPRSTLFMLVAAFAGLETMKSAYDHAMRNDYRFYSYGDASLLTLRSEAGGR